jgi:adenine-specific DNA methylase
MNGSEALAQIARLQAAYPKPQPDSTLAFYAEELTKLDSPAVLAAAVQKVIETERLWPSIATLRAAYFQERKLAQHQRPALPEPELTREQRDENLRRLRELARRSAPGDLP